MRKEREQDQRKNWDKCRVLGYNTENASEIQENQEFQGMAEQGKSAGRQTVGQIGSETAAGIPWIIWKR